MSEKELTLFSTGEFAKKAGITLRTLRYYDKIGLLKPNSHNDLGHRLYTKQDFGRLQKILTLKFIGLSLDDISNIMKYDINDQDFKKSLEIQKSIMEEKIHHIQMVIKSIDETVHMLDTDTALNWDKFINIINVINIDKNWNEQYENASNLKARIRIHELFSTNKEGWMNWFFQQMQVRKEASILELGCGDGSLWEKNFDYISSYWNITLTDFSNGMLKDAKKNLGSKAQRFKFELADAQNIPFDNNSFDVVIANHMLYHVADKDKAFSEIQRVLKANGCFYASTVGKNHMKEMREIVSRFNSENITTKSWDSTESFQLENGLKQVSKWFKEVRLNRYNDSLVVTDPIPLIDYIFSMPGNTKEIFTDKKLQQLINFLQKEIEETGGIYITKDTGFFQGRK
ncbi:methyltransferase domain-containing protein [Clostridiaceae bacterium UIB06]|uniref:Methyltransferase domain-containing protein n=1 Tax=Clostridium thailandense TaxID=2794346 RepID=A0A949WQL2_9CLOT|nr:MerR family transcriptional regulator [Clostridium thailandense]MBV7272916.1 methyltransferase domain-containing protein [Clostridium thailandense]MCH5136274.1 methyltransferase domain-containing protein [Clostridiaceae bacterium UIB06]